MASPPKLAVLDLRTYLPSHILRTAIRSFEAGASEWLKRALAELFPEQPDTPDLLAAAKAERTTQLAETKAEAAALRRQLAALADADGADKGELNADLKALEKQWLTLQRQEWEAAEPAEPGWLEVARTSAGLSDPPIAPLRAVGAWPTEAIASVMLTHLASLAPRLRGTTGPGMTVAEALERIREVARIWPHPAPRADLAEVDYLEFLDCLLVVLRACGPREAQPSSEEHPSTASAATPGPEEAVVAEIRDEAATLVAEARLSRRRSRHPPLLYPAPHSTQTLFTALQSWKGWVEAATEHAVEWTRDGVVLQGAPEELTEGLDPQLRLIAHRGWRWYFYPTARPLDLASVLKALTEVAAAFAERLDDGEESPPPSPWLAPTLAITERTEGKPRDVSDPYSLRLLLDFPVVRIDPPVPRVPNLVGREFVVERLIADLAEPGSRVLIHGGIGVGKDAVATHVVTSPVIRALGGMQLWIHGEPTAFDEQIVRCFARYLPDVITPALECRGAEKAAKHIKAWLETHNDWLLVVEGAEDEVVNEEPSILWNILPSTTTGGRVLLTSRSELHKTHPEFNAKAIALDPISTDDSLELLEAIVPNALSDADSCPPSPNPDHPNGLGDPVDGTSGGLGSLTASALEATEEGRPDDEPATIKLDTPEFREFLETELGNLPVSVALCGELLKGVPRLSTPTELMAAFRDRGAPSFTVDAQPNKDVEPTDQCCDEGSQPELARACAGLATLVWLHLDGLEADEGLSATDRAAATALLRTVALFECHNVSTALLTNHDPEFLTAALSPGHPDIAALLAPFCDAETFDRARAICVDRGLLRIGGGGAAPIESLGSFVAMPELVKGALRVIPTDSAKLFAEIGMQMLVARFNFTPVPPWKEWVARRALGPHVYLFLAAMRKFDGLKSSVCPACRAVLPLKSTDHYELVMQGAYYVLHVEQNARTAECGFEMALTHASGPDGPEKLDQIQDPRFVHVLWGLGRALEWLEQPEASLFHRLDAQELVKKLFPPDHLHHATAAVELASGYAATFQFIHAETQLRNALALRRRVLGEEHPAVADVMGELVKVYRHRRRNVDEQQLAIQTLELRTKILPPRHPSIVASLHDAAMASIGASMNTRASELSAQADALQEVLAPNDLLQADLINLRAMLKMMEGKMHIATALHFQATGFAHRALAVHAVAIARLNTNFSQNSCRVRASLESHKIQQLAVNELEPYDAERSSALCDLALIMAMRKRRRDARITIDNAISLARSAMPSPHIGLAHVLAKAAQVVAGLGRHGEAARIVSEAIDLVREHVDPDMLYRDLYVLHADATRYASVSVVTAEDAAGAMTLGNGVVRELRRWCDKHGEHTDLALALITSAREHSHGKPPSHTPDFAMSLKLVDEADEILERILPEGHGERMEAKVFRAGVLAAKGDAAEAQDILEKVLATQRLHLPPASPQLVLTMSKLAKAMIARGDLEAATKVFADALETDHPEELERTGSTEGLLSLLASAHSRAGRPLDVLEARTKIRALHAKMLEHDHPSQVPSMNNLASALSAVGRHDDAAALYEKTIEFQKGIQEAPADIGVTMANLAMIYANMGRNDDAIRVHEEAVVLQKQGSRKNDPMLGTTMFNLAETYAFLGRNANALRVHEEALTFRRAAKVPTNDIAESMNGLARVYEQVGRREDALKLREDVVTLLREAAPEGGSLESAGATAILGAMYTPLGKHTEALALHEESLAIRTRLLSPDHPLIAAATTCVAGCLIDLGRNADAVQIEHDLLKTRQAALPPKHPEIIVSMCNVATANLACGEHAEALTHYEAALAAQREVLPPDDPDLARLMNNLASTYGKLGRHNEALKLHKKVLAIRRKHLPASDPDQAVSLSNCASMYADLGQYDMAMAMEEEALAHRRKYLRPNHPDIPAYTMKLALMYSIVNQFGRAEQLIQSAIDMLSESEYIPGDPTMAEFQECLARVQENHRAYLASTARPAAKQPRVKPNEKCPCGSGVKWKKCCMNKKVDVPPS
eukprot:m.13848 g.13848  ORF g.13848 m.13848 type:complete len:2013 (+) comp4719_c0_seq1:256-6294(+)